MGAVLLPAADAIDIDYPDDLAQADVRLAARMRTP